MSELGEGLKAFQALKGKLGYELSFEHRHTLKEISRQANHAAGIPEEYKHLGEQYTIKAVLYRLPEGFSKDDIARTEQVVNFVIDGEDHLDAQDKGIERAAVLLGLV